MPAKSKAQLKAMYAAAAGRSTLGIPTKVGREFVQATPTAKKLPQHVHIHVHHRSTKRGS